MSSNTELIKSNLLALIKEEYVDKVKSGSVDEVVKIYNYREKILKEFLTPSEIVDFYEPVETDNTKVLNCPFVIAMLTGKVELCAWIYRMFNQNIMKNARNLPCYICIERVCGKGYLDVLKFINGTFYDVVRCGDWDTDPFLYALEYHQYDVLEYIYSMYGEEYVLTRTGNFKSVVRGIESKRFDSNSINYYAKRLLKYDKDLVNKLLSYC